eukprot:jgi/Botrbrau1/16584/Bobra.0068s0015.1
MREVPKVLCKVPSPRDSISRRRRGIEALPQDLLVKILASLERRGLRTARLVCRAFRAASIPCVTCLTYDCDTEMDEIVWDPLLYCLQVFTCVIDLVLYGSPEGVVDMLREPGVLPRLRTLKLFGEHEWEKDGAASSICDLVPLLPGATRLTSLKVLPCLITSVKAAAHLARALAACPALEQLHIGSRYIAPDVFGCAALRQVLGNRSLRGFDYVEFYDNDWLWTCMMADLARLTHLQALEEVPLRSRADCEALAAHTQLSRLAVSVPDDASVLLALLSCLTALQVLRLKVENLSPREVGELVAPMASLHTLCVDCEVIDPDLSQLDAVVATLPALTELSGLSVHAAASTILPEGPRPNGFAGLRRLSLCLRDDAGEWGNFSAALAGLEFLELTCTSVTLHKVARQLPPMPHVTELKITALLPESLGYPSARFLAEMPRLRCLDLRNVLDPSRWDEEVRYIAALTELRELGICSDLWWHEATRFASLRWTQVQPLTALRQLDVIKVTRPWEGAIQTLEFGNGMEQVRWEMGLPSTKILDYDY